MLIEWQQLQDIISACDITLNSVCSLPLAATAFNAKTSLLVSLSMI